MAGPRATKINYLGRELSFTVLDYDKKRFLEKGLQTGHALWPSATLLCDFMVENKERISGKRVLEIGCGLGIGGTVAALLGASSVDFSDGDDSVLEKTCLHAKKNLEHVPCQLAFEVIRWGPDEIPPNKKFDIIIGSDLIYGKRKPDESQEDESTIDVRVLSLLNTVKSMLETNSGSFFYLAFERREIPLSDFEIGAVRVGLKCAFAEGEYFEDIFANRAEEQTDFWRACILVFQHAIK